MSSFGRTVMPNLPTSRFKMVKKFPTQLGFVVSLALVRVPVLLESLDKIGNN